MKNKSMIYHPFYSFSDPFSEKDICYSYERIYLIRRFEEKILDLFTAGKLNGTTHAYIGQEANAVSVVSCLIPEDTIFSNHRCHGHYLAFTDDAEGLMAEMMGLSSGVCGGLGGSQHLQNGGFFSNGIQGGIVPIASGVAFAEKTLDSSYIAVVFIGDGTLGQGVVYETLNLAGLWDLPILFVLENNYYAQSTPSHLQIAGDIYRRSEAYNIKWAETNSNDIRIIHPVINQSVEYVRTMRKPFFLILNTYRLCHHSKNDDYRPKEEVETWYSKDPLLLAEDLINDLKKEIENKVDMRLMRMVKQFLNEHKNK